MHRTGTAPQSVTYGAPGRTPGRQPGRLVLFRSFEHRQADGQRTSWTVAVCIISITKRGEERRGKRKAERFGSRAEQKKKERGEIETVRTYVLILIDR